MKARIPFLRTLGVCLWLGLTFGMAAPGLAQIPGGGGPEILPVLKLRVPVPETSEGPTLPGTATVTGMFELFRDGPTNQELLVSLQIGGTATPGVDYATLPTLLSVPAGVRSVPLAVQPIDDTLVEGTETVELRLVYPPLASPLPMNYVIGSPSNGVVRILDNDPPPVTLAVVTIVASDPEAAEPGAATVINDGEFTISRTGSTNFALPVLLRIGGTASNGVDYATLPNTVVIPIGAASTRVRVAALFDLLPEATETVVLRVESPVCIAIYPPPPECYAVGRPAEAVVKIVDNRLAPTNRPPEVKLTKPLDGQTFALPGKVPLRTDALDADGYVPHMEFYDGDVKIGDETRMFLVAPPPGQHHIFEMTWTNPPVGRHVLRAKAQDDDGAFGWSAPVTIWVVQTNEPPVTNRPIVVTITAPDPVASEGTNCVRWPDWPIVAGADFRGTNTALFVIKRTGPTNDPLTVYYHIGGTASNGVDYIQLPDHVTIPAGRRAAEFKVVPIDDTLPEPLETVVLSLRVPPDATANVPPYMLGSPNRAAAVIVDNDQPRPVTSVLPDHCFHMMRPGDIGGWYRIEWSSDFHDWTVLGTNQVVEGALHFVDPDADDSIQRFYRTVPTPAPAPAPE